MYTHVYIYTDTYTAGDGGGCFRVGSPSLALTLIASFSYSLMPIWAAERHIALAWLIDSQTNLLFQLCFHGMPKWSRAQF